MEEDQQNLNNNNLPAYGGGPWWKPGMRIFSEISTWIVAPIVLALIFGKMLDARYGTKPVIFLLLASLAFLFSCFKIVQIVKNYMKKINPDVKSGPQPESVGENKK